MSKIISWNLLYSDCTPTLSVQERTAGNSPYNLWMTRCELICKKLIELQADIYLLQEVNPKMMTFIHKRTALAYTISEQCKHDYLHCAIAYNFDKFEMLDSDSLTIGRNITSRLRRREDGKIFCVTSCHLKAGETLEDDRKRVFFMRSIIDAQNLYMKDNDVTVIGGDFNFDDALYGTMYNSNQYLSRVGLLLDDRKFKKAVGRYLTFHGKNENGVYSPASFDNVYISQHVQFVNVNVKPITRCLPDENNPSDHTWIQVEIEFLSPNFHFI